MTCETAPDARDDTSPVRVRCIGTGDAFGSGGRLQSAYALEYLEHLYLLDFGATSLPGLARCGVRPEDVEVVVISHYHGDHYGGLPFLLRYRQLNHVATPLTICGPPGLEGRLERALEAFFPPCRSGEVGRLATLLEIGEEPERVGDLHIRGFPADHRPETNPMTLRIRLGGVTIGYSGDSAWNPGVEAAGREADLFIVEAYRWEPVRHHMSIADLVEHLPTLGCQRVLLTHSGRDVLARPPSLAGCVMAEDGIEVIVHPRRS